MMKGIIITVSEDGKRLVYYGTENIPEDAIIKIPIEPYNSEIKPI